MRSSGLSPITNDSFLTFVSYLLAPSPGQLVRSYKLEEIELSSGTTSVLGDYVSGMAAKPQFLNGSLYIALKEAAYGYQNMSSMGYGGIAKVIQKDVKNPKGNGDFSGPHYVLFLPLDTSIIYFKDNLIQDASEVWEVKNGKQVKIGDCSLLVSEIVNEQGRWFVIGKTATSGWDLYELNRTSFEATRTNRYT